jgi:hypothetical protein
MRDADGRSWSFELVRVAPTPGRYRYAYGHTGFMHPEGDGPAEDIGGGAGRVGKTGESAGARVFGPHGAVVKMDADVAVHMSSAVNASVDMSTGKDVSRDVSTGACMDASPPSVVTWSDGRVFPSEPLFVPRPGGTAEDDGVLLILGYDTERRESALVIIEANSMTELARAYTGGTRCPPSFHGQWIPHSS